MSNPGGGGGGGVRLPPLVQPVIIQTGINGSATAGIGQVAQAVNQATTAVGGMGTAWNGMNTSLSKSVHAWRTAGDNLRMTGSLMMYQIAMPLKAIGKAAIQASMEFETSMKHIQGLVGMTGAQVSMMSEKVLDMSGAVGKAPTELANALYYITSAGITNTTTALDTLNVSARAASAGLGTTQDVANLSTSVMNAYAPGLYNASVATDALVAAVREGKAEASEFAPAMGKVIPVAASFGVKFQDVAAAIAALTRQGAPAGTAAIQLRQILASLLDPTQKATEQLAAYGLSAGKLRSTIQQEGLLAGLMELKTAFGDNASELSQVFGNIRPLQAVMALIGPSFSRNAQIFNELNDSAGDASAAFEVASQALGFKLNQASAQAKVSLVKIGDALAPVIKLFADMAVLVSKGIGFVAGIPGIVKMTAMVGGLAIVMTSLVRSFASYVRLKSYTTIALQSITNGFYDQTTGMITNIQTGQTYAATAQQAAAAGIQMGSSAGVAGSMMMGLSTVIGELSAFIAELMAVITENTLITAENTKMNQQLAASQGIVVTSTTAETDSVLAGNTALSQWANSSNAAAAATNNLSGAQTGATVATNTNTGANATNATSNIAMANSIRQNVLAVMQSKIATTGATVATSTFGIVTQYVAIQVKAATASIRSMIATMLPMAAAFLAVYGAIKLVKFAINSGNKEVNNSYKAMTSLTDKLSNFRVAPIVIGMDVQYTVNGAKAKSASQDSLIDEFETFLFNKDEKGNPQDQGKKIQKEIDGFAQDVKDGVLSGNKKISTAVALIQTFGADTKTRDAATAYFARRFQINKDQLAKAVTSSSGDAKQIFEDNLLRFQKDIAAGRTNASYIMPSNMTNMTEYFKNLIPGAEGLKQGDWEKGLGKDALDQVAMDIKNTGEGLVAPLVNSLNAGGGSSQQFVGGLQKVYESALAAGKSTIFAEDATLKFAKAAFKSAGMSDKGATVQELLRNNTDKLNTSMTELAGNVELSTGKTDASSISAKELIDSFNSLSVSSGSVVRDIQQVSEVVSSLKMAFDGGLNPFVQDAVDIFDAYTEALKNAKKGQEALFGSQASLIDSQANYSSAISTALTDIRTAGGDIAGYSADSLKAQQSLVGVFKASTEVANAVYANTTGTAEQRQAAATKAAADYINAANDALIKKGGISKDALDKFWSTRMGKQITVGGAVIQANAEYLGMTFGQTEIATDGGKGAGADTVDGAVVGVQESNNKLEKAMIKSAKLAVRTYKKTLGIKSPSTVFRDQVGIPMVDGVIEGVRMKSNALEVRMATYAKNAVNRARKVISTSPITVPITTSDTPSPEDSAAEARAAADAAFAKDAKAKELKDAKAKAVKLHGKKLSSSVYDVLATNLAGQGPAAIMKQAGKTALENFAEGVLAAQDKVKTNVTKLIKAIISEVSDKLSTFSATVSAQINLAQAQNDLKKFMVNNTPEMLAASVAAATRAVNQSQMKYGAGQGTEVTQYERSKISTAKAAAEQAQRDYRLGKISYADMIDAQNEYANVQAAASEASKENADAQNSLTDAQFAQTNQAILLVQEQLKLVDAQNSLTTAYINAKISSGDLVGVMSGLATQAGLSASVITGMVASFTALTGLTPASLGISTGVASLLNPAAGEAAGASITGAPLPMTKPKNPKKGQMYRNSKGIAMKWDGKKWVAVPGYAMGGNMLPGRIAMVGENGPELVRPASAMNVTPFSVLEQYARTLAHGGGDGGYESDGRNINIVVNNPVPERASDSIARRMQNMSSLGLFS